MKKYLLFIAMQITIIADCYSQTNVSGVLTGNVTWDLAGSPYIVTGDITISQGSVLNINPAVVVKVDNLIGFYVDGTIRAIGTSDSLIEFKSNQFIPPTNPVYRGFCFSQYATDYVFSSGTGSILQYCKIQNCGGSSLSNCFISPINVVINSQEACPFVDNCIFYQCAGVWYGQNLRSDFYFTNNKIMSAYAGSGLFSLYFQPNHAAVLSCNIFKDLYFFSPGITAYGRKVEFSNNIFTSIDLIGDLVSGDYFNFNNNMICNFYSSTGISRLIGISDTMQNNLIAYNYSNYYMQFIEVWDTLAVITNNNFIGNIEDTTFGNLSDYMTNYILRQWYNSPLINATNNYWGTTNINDINNLIYDYYDDTSYHQINFQPFLISPDTNAPVSPVQNIIRTNLGGNNVQLTWDPNPESDIAGYRIYWGGYTGYSFSNHIDAGNVTTYTLSGVAVSDSISVTAYDNNSISFSDFCSGQESWFSMPKLTLVGVNEFKVQGLKIKVFPNPVKEELMVSSYLLTGKKAELTIYDLFGREVFQLETRNLKPETKINVSNFSQGIYFVELQSGEQVLRGKFLKE